ncbi:MAG: hypothetical protein KAI43_01690, partial [Candidatus Aureabacteria bacterium]|nr:hypothetical protein [Candidatus Auribacterota bacterium]
DTSAYEVGTCADAIRATNLSFFFYTGALWRRPYYFLFFVFYNGMGRPVAVPIADPPIFLEDTRFTFISVVFVFLIRVYSCN